jgi:hypothetical protein
MEIIVDCYGAEEQAIGWYCYLEDQLSFPFQASCIAERKISPLQAGEMVTVTEMAPQEECEHEMFAMIQWQQRSLAVPLGQLKPVAKSDADTLEAVADWHYWLEQGYKF